MCRDGGKTSLAWRLTLLPQNPILLAATHDLPPKPGKNADPRLALAPVVEDIVHTAIVTAESETHDLLERRQKANR